MNGLCGGGTAGGGGVSSSAAAAASVSSIQERISGGGSMSSSGGGSIVGVSNSGGGSGGGGCGVNQGSAAVTGGSGGVGGSCGSAVAGTGSPSRRGCPTGLPQSMISGGPDSLRKSRSQGGKKLQKCLSTASYGEESSLTRPQMTPLSHNLLVTRQYCSFGSTTS